MRYARTALVTGASSGIGRELSLELARKGVQVAVVARRTPELEALVREIEGTIGGRALAITADVADTEAITLAVQRAERELGSLDMVIANAGVGTHAHASTLRVADVSRVIDVNVTGAFATLLAAIPIMIAQQRGHLVGMSSLAGRRALPLAATYSASKAALSAFLESLRLDLYASGIAVTDVQPGFVDTPLTRGQLFPRPFQWSASRAARYIVKKLEGAPAVVAFPLPLTAATALARHLPTWLYDPIMRLPSKG